MNPRRLLLRIALPLLASLVPLSGLYAAPGFNYEVIYINGQQMNESLQVRHVAINNSGQVVFMTEGGPAFGTLTYRVYLATPGQAPQLVLETLGYGFEPTSPNIDPTGDRTVGINDDGIVAIPLIWTEYDQDDNPISNESGYGLYEPGVGLIREIRGLRWSAGNVNSSLQMAGRDGANTQNVIVTDGLVSASSPAPFNTATVQINEQGTIATTAIANLNQSTVFFGKPPAQLQAVEIGDNQGLGYNISIPVPGLNDLGWMSLATDNGTAMVNPNPRVLLIDPAGNTHVVTEANNTDFVNFRQPRQPVSRGVGLNNNNRVSFVAESLDGSQAIWFGDASGDAPRLAVEETIEFVDGRSLVTAQFANDVSNTNVNSLNDAGELAVIAFGTLYNDQGAVIRSSTQVLFVARPVAGSEPGNPIIPELEDALPGPQGGWRFRGRCWRATLQDIAGSCNPFGGVGLPTPRMWIDPPIAVGYDFTIDDTSVGEFRSVLIAAPLPGGDSEFLVEVNGAPAVLEAGTVLDLTTVSAEPIRTFRISGIDQAESLDPNDPTVFVTGLTFSADTDENVTYTMVPVVIDPDDADGDGVPDVYDDFPNDPTQSGDTDGDGLDDNIDTDDDGDGVPDNEDDYPWGRFDDAPPGYWSFAFIEALARTGITAGCGGDNYCPSAPVTRAQMAVFLERGINGAGYTPPAAVGNVFLDVGAEDFAAGFIEQLFADGITVGCGNGNYCPAGEVTRAQMAVFLLRAKYGAGYSPPAATGIFDDVDPGYWAAAWIEQLATDGITSGCGNGIYCPDAAVTRDQMAVFLVRTFGL